MEIVEIYRQVMDLWQNPGYTELSVDALLGATNRCVTQLLTELDLTPDAGFQLAKSSEFSFASVSAREKDLSAVIVDISRPIRVESRPASSTSEDEWCEERQISFENWNDAVERNDGNFVSFYGTPPVLTMVVARDVSNLKFRIIYQQAQDKLTSTGDEILLPDLCEPLLVYAIALEVGEMIDNNSEEFLKKKTAKMNYLLGRLMSAKEQFDRWRRSQRGTSVTSRRPFNDRSGGLNIRGRKFTVNY